MDSFDLSCENKIGTLYSIIRVLRKQKREFLMKPAWFDAIIRVSFLIQLQHHTRVN